MCQKERCHKSVDNATKVPIDPYKSEEIAMKWKKNLPIMSHFFVCM